MHKDLVEYPLIPQPRSLTPAAGAFSLNAQTRISVPPAATKVLEPFIAGLRNATGFALPTDLAEADEAAENTIVFVLAGTRSTSSEEAYELQVAAEHVIIRANGVPGLFYGAQTLRQLLPVEIESAGPVQGVSWTIRAVHVSDEPRYRWRGMHLDVGRYIYPVQFLKKFLDLMALHKFNKFHWHLTEDQGWRIEINQYPKLTEIGAWRSASPYPEDRTKLDGQPYGGFYTQDEVREIVEYALARCITVVPEIDMPGHALAALASYPELGCVGKGYKVWTSWGIAEDVFCAGNESVYTFLENVLTEVLDLFPSEYIHIGGDECPKVRWQACPKCQAKIQQEGLKDEYELQSYFIRHMEHFLSARGRRLIGWDEILEGGLAPNATVMSWRGTQGGIDAASTGHDVVMAPNTHCYINFYQSRDYANEPPNVERHLPLEKVYQFVPTEGVPAEQAHHVIGGQGCMWGEYLPTSDRVEYMANPRVAALAETIWTAPEPRDFDDFARRLRPHLARIDRLGFRYRDPFTQQ